MKSSLAWATAALAATTAAKTSVMLPFYNYPTFDAAGVIDAEWTALFAALSANPALHFYVIVNPDNGPTARPVNGGYQDQPYGMNKDWVTAVDRLNAHPNVQTIGYVATDRCSLKSPRTLADIEADLENWSHWSTTTTAAGWGAPARGSTFNISISGIFYDETAQEGNADVLNCYRTLKSYTDSKFKAAGRPAAPYSLVFNPGANVTASMLELFTLGDAVVNSETCYTDVIYEEAECGKAGQSVGWIPFSAATMRSTPRTYLPYDQKNWAKTSVLIHGFNNVSPSSKVANTTTLTDAIKSVVEKGVHSLYFTTKGWNTFVDGPADITTVSKIIAQAV